MLTIDDLRNPKLKSGFNYVANHDGGNGSKPFYAQRDGSGYRAKGGIPFKGKRRATAQEAVQDFLAYANGLTDPTSLASLRFTTPTVDMGTNKVHAPAEPPRKNNRKVFTGPHDLYDVVFYDPDTGVVIRRKVGITARGRGRYAGIATTFGWSIKPLAKAVTYPTLAAAEAAETAKIVEIAVNDTDKWTRCGKESFRPTNFPRLRIKKERTLA